MWFFLNLCQRKKNPGTALCFLVGHNLTNWRTSKPNNTVFYLIRAQGALVRSDLISCAGSWGSGLSNVGFGLKIGQLLRKLRQIWSVLIVFGIPQTMGAPLLGRIRYTECWISSLILHKAYKNFLITAQFQLRILAMHDAKSVYTQSIKNLRWTFFNNGPQKVKVRSKLKSTSWW